MTREEAIKELASHLVHWKRLKNEHIVPTDECENTINALRMAIEALQDRPTGEWLEVEVFPEVYDIEGVKTWGSEMQCDQCGFRHTAIEGHMGQYNFCPNCGADMRGDVE